MLCKKPRTKTAMTTYFDHTQVDRYRESLIKSREKTSVLKIKVLSVRSQLGPWPIFIFEGPDDKSLFGEWIRRLAPQLVYEPIIASGKDQALKYYDTLVSDVSEFDEWLYFFIDRDFDDLKGREPSAQIFITDHYAVENYVVNEQVLDEALKDELHCHGEIQIRAEVIEAFRKIFEDFLSIVKPLNFKLYCARRYDVAIDNLPKRISKIADIDYDGLTAAELPCEQGVTLAREFTLLEVSEATREFESLDPRTRYRGKFSMMFFVKWLEMLTLMRNTRTGVMTGLSGEFKVRCNFGELGRFASKSSPPGGLISFLERVQEHCVDYNLVRNCTQIKSCET